MVADDQGVVGGQGILGQPGGRVGVPFPVVEHHGRTSHDRCELGQRGRDVVPGDDDDPALLLRRGARGVLGAGRDRRLHAHGRERTYGGAYLVDRACRDRAGQTECVAQLADTDDIVIEPERRRRVGWEIAIVLALSLGASAVYAAISLLAKLTEPGKLSDQTATVNQSYSRRPYLDLTYQLLGIFFALIPVALVLYLMSEGGRSAVRRLGLDVAGGRWKHDALWGAALAAVIGIPGLGLYYLAKALDLNATIVPTSINDHWWTVPVLFLSALQNALLEEVVVVGYLMTRLKQLDGSPAGCWPPRRCCAGAITSTRASAPSSGTRSWAWSSVPTSNARSGAAAGHRAHDPRHRRVRRLRRCSRTASTSDRRHSSVSVLTGTNRAPDLPLKHDPSLRPGAAVPRRGGGASGRDRERAGHVPRDRRRQRIHGRDGRRGAIARRRGGRGARPGYGAAVHSGLVAATADHVAVMDGDGSMDPHDLLPMLADVAAGHTTMAVGRRRPNGSRRLALARPLRQRGGPRLAAARTGLAVHDIAPMRVVRRQDLLDLDVQDRRFGYPVELLVKAQAAGWTLTEHDITYRPRAEGTRSKVSGSVTGTLRTARDFARMLP